MTQQEALDILKMGHNVFLTGPAGSGKTYVLNTYITYLREHGVEIGITASTGIAATHMNGMTIHSWSGLGIRDELTEMELDAMEEKRYLWSRFEHAKVLIIDEVSMLHHFRLDLVDKVCKAFKRNNRPFGGLQVVLCGDFFQLPPIARRGEPDAHFVYRSQAWHSMNLKICYLHEQFRQKDDAFLEVLNDIRASTVSDATLHHLKSRFGEEPKPKVRPTKLYTHNVDVDMINQEELEKLPGKVHDYRMTSKGREHLIDTLQKSCLAPQTLRLKKGAHVMFVKNNTDAGYVNGTLGTVVGFDDEDDWPIVEIADGRKITASPIDWQISEEGKMLAEINQVPLRLAWAITIHKSQGMSLDAVEIDLSKSFEHGMGYVALSRVRSLDGLKLLGLNDVALKINPEVLKFDEQLQEASDKAADELHTLRGSQIKAHQKEFIERISPSVKEKDRKLNKLKKIPTHHATKLLIEERMSLKAITEKRGLTAETVIDHIEKVRKEGIDLDIEYLKRDAFDTKRFNKIIEAIEASYEKVGDYRLAPVKNALGNGYSYAEIRLARLFI